MTSKLDPERPRALDISGSEPDSDQPEQTLFPTFWNRVISTVVDKTVEVTHLSGASGDGLTRSEAEKKPENVTRCSLISSGAPHKCN